MMSLRDERGLAPSQLRRRCDPASLGFASTAEISPVDGMTGQPRALRALELAVEIPQLGYNVLATGPDGTGRAEAIETYLRAHASGRPAPPDIVFLFNFAEPSRPVCATLPPGLGRALAHSMSDFVEHASREIPRAFESESYQRRRAEAVEPFEHQHQELLEEVRSFARSRGLDLEVTPAGVVSIPLVHGERLSPQEYERLPEAERRELEAAGHQVEERMAHVFPQLRDIDARVRERVGELEREVVLFAVGHLIDDIKRANADHQPIVSWLEAVLQDVIDNFGGFLQAPETAAKAIASLRGMLAPRADSFRARYEVNVFVGDGRGCAPVVVERNPTFARLFGRIEFETTLGAAYTDHRHIRAGALHRASGGYLILRAADVLRAPFVWEKLKDALRCGRTQIENPAEQYMMFPSATLVPDAVPIDVRVVLVASSELYELMAALDEDVRELFRVRADFDTRMHWGDTEPAGYGAFISDRVRRDGLLHFDASAVARVVEHGARRAAHQGRLSTRFPEIADLLCEASHWATRAGAELVGAEHVERALEERRGRSDLLEERLAEMVGEGDVRIELRGSAVGQLNGLAVIELGGRAFGHPARITATTAPGGGELVSIDRESKLSGRIHDKGFLTLRGYLEDRYGDHVPLSLSASLTFEQSYGMMDGDSASSTELYALLSSLAGAPIDQGIAVTGSVDQRGNVQAVGGVSEKIEGFFDACERAGLTGTQGVLMPRANQAHLMLEKRVVAAVAAGHFHVWAVESIDEGIEILTGVQAGTRGADGSYPEGSLHRRVQDRLLAMAASAREWAQPPASGRQARAGEANAPAEPAR